MKTGIIKAEIKKAEVKLTLFTAILTFAVMIAIVVFLTLPRYIPFNEGMVSLTEMENGMLLAVFTDKVSGFDIDRFPTEDHTAYIYGGLDIR